MRRVPSALLRLSVLAATVAVVACSAVTRAAASPSREVLVTVGGDPDEAEKLEAILRELLARLGVTATMRVARHVDPEEVLAPPPAALAQVAVARVFIELAAGDVAIVYITDARWERILVRRAPLPAPVDEVAREEIAHIVEASVEALLAGGVVGVARAALAPRALAPPVALAAIEPPARPPAAAGGAPGPGPRLELGLGYEALAWSRPYVAHGPVASLAYVAGAPVLRYGALATAQVRVPVVAEADHTPVAVRLTTTSLRLLAQVARPVSDRVSARVGLGGGVDVLAIEPRAKTASSDVTTAPARTRISAIVRGSFALDVALGQVARASVAFVVDDEIAGRDYVVRRADGSGDETVLGTYVVRVGLALGITADLLAR